MRISLAVLLIALSPAATARCIVQSFEVSGYVLDAQGAPVAEAMVGVSWAKGDFPQGPVIALTDSNGHYAIPIFFDTWSGISEWGDDCDAQLGRLSVSAYTRTAYALPEIVVAGQHSKLSVPALKISQVIRRETDHQP